MPEGPRPRLDTFRAPLAAALEEGVYLIKPIRGEPGALVGSHDGVSEVGFRVEI
jgi:hypothetical protein